MLPLKHRLLGRTVPPSPIARATILRAGRQTFVALVLSVACNGPAEGQCVALAGRYTELLAHANSPQISPRELASLREQAEGVATRTSEIRHCRSAVSLRGYTCAMGAPNADEFEKCLLPQPY